MRVTEHYQIQGEVPFVNVHVERDNRLFLDPSAIRNDPSPLARRAQKLLETYFSEVMRLRRSQQALDLQQGRQLLSGLREPNENRLGFTRTGVGGHAIGPGIADDLWDLLGSNAAAAASALSRIEDIPLFIKNVGDDLISDLTTRVVYPVLAEFTADMVALYPSLGRRLTTEMMHTYSPHSRTWEEAVYTLPYVEGHQLLLIPKNWVFWRMLMDSDAFYNRFATTTVQNERTVVDLSGKVMAPSKEALKKEFPDRKSLNTQRAELHLSDGRCLVTEYRTQVDREFEPLTQQEIIRRTVA